MSLVNGAGYSISGSTGTRNTADSTTAACHSSTTQDASGKIAFYLNDVLLFESTGTFTDTLYALCNQYHDTAEITLTTNSGGIIEWTMPTAFFVDDAASRLGADQDAGTGHFYDMFVRADIERKETSPDKYFIEKLTVDTEVYEPDPMIEITSGDVLKIKLSAVTPTSSGTLLPPPYANIGLHGL